MAEPAADRLPAHDELSRLLDRLEELLAQAEKFDPPVREQVFELLDGVDALHRVGITRIAAVLGEKELERVRRADSAADWLFTAYGVGVNDVEAASAALGTIRPYIHEHGGEVEVLGVEDGVVHVKLSGACSGCTASSITLREGVEEALRHGVPGFVAMEVAPDNAAHSHPPPGPTLLQIQPRPT